MRQGKPKLCCDAVVVSVLTKMFLANICGLGWKFSECFLIKQDPLLLSQNGSAGKDVAELLLN